MSTSTRPLMDSALNLVGHPVHPHSVTTTMFVPLELAVVVQPTKPILPSPFLVTTSLWVAPARTSCIPALRGSAEVAIPSLVALVRSTPVAAVAPTTPATVFAPLCWLVPQGNNS